MYAEVYGYRKLMSQVHLKNIWEVALFGIDSKYMILFFNFSILKLIVLPGRKTSKKLFIMQLEFLRKTELTPQFSDLICKANDTAAVLDYQL